MGSNLGFILKMSKMAPVATLLNALSIIRQELVMHVRSCNVGDLHLSSLNKGRLLISDRGGGGGGRGGGLMFLHVEHFHIDGNIRSEWM